MPPKFSLLIHGQDGNIPYLTPELIRLMFPQSNCDEIENGVNTSGGSHGSLRDHLILGVAVKDTCVTPIYRDDIATAGHAKKKEGLKRKRGQNGVEGKSGKWVKTNSEGKAADPSVHSVSIEVTNEMIEPDSEGDGSTSTSKQSNGINKNYRIEDRVKKPAGYTFFTPASSLKICEDIHSGRILYERERGASISTNLMQAHLRIAPHISTLLVPTFSFVGSCNAGNCGRSEVGVKNESMGYKPKQQEDHVQARKKQKQQPKPPQNGTCIPKSSKDKVSIQTPHGWQVITPGQYINACNSLVVYVSSTSSDKKGTNNEGAVGLFDHVDITPSQISALLQQECWSKDSDESGDKNVGREDSNNSLMVKQAFKKIGVSVQKTNGWTNQIQSSSTPLSPPLWTPINIFAPQLPKFKVPDDISNSSRVAIVGWDCIPSVQEYRLQRRACLRGAIGTIQSSSSTLVNERKFLLLAVSDIQSILDAAREGVSIIGTNVAATWSLSGKALVLDFHTKETIGIAQNGGIIDLNDDKYTRDSLPLLPGCKCLSCRPRSNHHSQRPEGYRHFLRFKIDDSETPPSFSRAYIHHLLRAKEMLAETLLFAHNLHQLLILFQELSSAARLDDKSSFEQKRCEKTTELESLCQIIERQIQTAGDE